MYNVIQKVRECAKRGGVGCLRSTSLWGLSRCVLLGAVANRQVSFGLVLSLSSVWQDGLGHASADVECVELL